MEAHPLGTTAQSSAAPSGSSAPTSPPPRPPPAALTTMAVGALCWICAQGTGRTRRSVLQRSCACRGDHSGWAHLHCLVNAATRSNPEIWSTCPTCTQDFTGALQLGLAQASWELWRGKGVEDGRRLEAADRLAGALQTVAHDYPAALRLYEEVLAISRRVDGDDDSNTLISINNLAGLHQRI